MALDPAVTQKRLGDGFYEQRLVREQIGQLTGTGYLSGYADDESQYRALLTNGATFAKEHQLVPGVALTAEQMSQLTSDLVWLVEQTVTLADGTTQRVLVPQVYLVPREGDLLPSGAGVGDKLSKSDLMSMPWSQRLCEMFNAAEQAIHFLDQIHRETGLVCTEALGTCRRWLDGEDIDPKDLAWYLDADEKENPWMRESLFSTSQEGLDALIFVTLVIGHAAYHSYSSLNKSEQMSETISEAGEEIVPAIDEYGSRFGL